MTMFPFNAPDLNYLKIADLTPEEADAVAAYKADSGVFHLVGQGGHTMADTDMACTDDVWRNSKIASLKTATQKFKLTAPATVYSGFGNGIAAIGSLGLSDPNKFIGMHWNYPVVTSTSTSLGEAINFLSKRTSHKCFPSILLQFELPDGFRALPMSECIQSDSEAELLLGGDDTFEISSSEVVNFQGHRALHFTLKPV